LEEGEEQRNNDLLTYLRCLVGIILEEMLETSQDVFRGKISLFKRDEISSPKRCLESTILCSLFNLSYSRHNNFFLNNLSSKKGFWFFKI
jgi:hypothetical protein